MTGETSGTTVTFVVIDGWTITVASVGDSRCILDTQGGVVSLLTVDHRLEENVEERERVTASGGEVGRLNVFGGNEVYFDYFCLLFKKKRKKRERSKKLICIMYHSAILLVPICIWFIGWPPSLLAWRIMPL